MWLTEDRSGPIGFVSIIIFIFAWPKPRDLPVIQRQPWKRFDIVGSFLVVAASCLVVFAFQNEGESIRAVWQDAIFLGPLLAGIATWIALGLWEYIVTYKRPNWFNPVFPVSLFKNRFYTGAAISTLFMGFPFIMLLYSVPLRAQVVSGKSTLVSGIMLLPMLGTTAIGTVASAAVNGKKNYFFETILLGACLMTLGCGLLSTVGGDGNAKLLGFLTFTGFGFGISVTATTMTQNFEAPIKDFGKLCPKAVEFSIANSQSACSRDHSPTAHLGRKHRHFGFNSPCECCTQEILD